MNSSSAAQLLNGIDQTRDEIAKISGVDSIVDSFLAKFLVVYISGIYEEATEQIIIDFVSRNTGRKEITAFVQENIHRHFRNPDFSKICELVGYCGNKLWQAELKKLTTEGLALDSIVHNKNALAHGDPTTITLSDIDTFYTLSRKIIEKVDFLMA